MMFQFPLPGRPAIPSRTLILAGAAFTILANNGALFDALSKRLDLTSPAGAAFALSLYLLLISGLVLVMFIAGIPWTLKPLLIAFVALSATLSYFSDQLGIVFDIDMIRNIAETVRDRNRQEAFELLSPPLVTHVLLYAALPSLAIAWVKPVYDRAARELLLRLACATVLIGFTGAIVWANFRFTSYFVRENRELRVYAIPAYPIFAAQKYAGKRLDRGHASFNVLGLDAKQRKTGARRTIGVMVVGETARADHFSLNGYPRTTTPFLNEEAVVDFSNATAAGTSTAYSVPAMFSFLAPESFSPEKAGAQSNVLDVLLKCGVHVVWIENNSSSKGVADRVTTVDLRKDPDPYAPLYSDGGYFDEALVHYLDECISESSTEDTLIVLHTMGSHGPTYHKRYPQTFARFTPDCREDSPQECAGEEVVNAYDNTILYTDYVLHLLIEYLKALGPDYDAFLFYASDHGESLGEKGLYLHGMPPLLAPPAQTHIPMLAWLSENFRHARTVNTLDEAISLEAPISHANVPHTLLGAFEIETSLYQSSLDILNMLRAMHPPDR